MLSEILERATKRNEANNATLALSRLLQILSNQERWNDIVSFLRNCELQSSHMEETTRWAANNRYKFAKPFVTLISEIDNPEEIRHDLRNSLAETIRKRYDDSFTWRHEVHPMLVGRALEQAGIFKETLPFYEIVASAPILSKELRQLAWQRWARTKWLQALRERDLKSSGRFDKTYKEAVEKAENCGFRTPEAIPEDLPSPLPNVDLPPAEMKQFPGQSTDLPKPHPTPSPLPKTDYSRTLAIGKFEVRVNSEGTRVNITHRETLQTASVRTPQMTATFEGSGLEINSSGMVTLADWGLTLNLSSIPSGKLGILTSDELELKIPVMTLGSAD